MNKKTEDKMSEITKKALAESLKKLYPIIHSLPLTSILNKRKIPDTTNPIDLSFHSDESTIHFF